MADSYRVIAQAQAAYARALDNDELESWPAFFTEACTYVVTSADAFREGLEGGIIFCDSRGMLKDRISALREANIYERQAYRHILGAPYIGAERGDRVDAETPFMVARIMRTGETSLFVTGRYIDTWIIKGDRALIEQRQVVCDSARIDTLLAIPL